jgi:hypothetical protein
LREGKKLDRVVRETEKINAKRKPFINRKKVMSSSTKRGNNKRERVTTVGSVYTVFLGVEVGLSVNIALTLNCVFGSGSGVKLSATFLVAYLR